MHTLLGLCRLALMLARTGGARGPYWEWRLHTAFGDRPPATPAARLRAVLELARWMSRIRRSGS